MNEKQLLSELKTKYYKVGTPANAEASEAGRAIRKAEGANWMVVGVYELTDKGATRKNFSYYVFNPGTVDEYAIPDKNNPLVPQTDAKTPVETWKPDNLLGSQKYAGYQVVETNTEQKWAIATVYEDISGKVSQKKVFVTDKGILPYEG